MYGRLYKKDHVAIGTWLPSPAFPFRLVHVSHMKSKHDDLCRDGRSAPRPRSKHKITTCVSRAFTHTSPPTIGPFRLACSTQCGESSRRDGIVSTNGKSTPVCQETRT
ncbi:hypothetical protein CEP54_001528 [Fusarium duplospermum]|uniref:Uncharacterized protein n=1 Tax=Fusarium duplospermum TaxID=1325734 RepID=A0A428R109_9HYPO|nr:hypothetical protein CEP54_001528 [Fusarium duplospermum]